jgi:hypothetical protein
METRMSSNTDSTNSAGISEWVFGSARESVRVRILRGSAKSNEFSLGGSQTLRLQ